MPLTSESFQAVEDAVNRLATETILAQAGRDDGLVPAYSLLGEIRELCSMDAALREPVAAALEKYLDAALPFDDAMLGRLRRLIEWLPTASEAVRAGRVVSVFGGKPT